jgi:hypothetical protein
MTARNRDGKVLPIIHHLCAILGFPARRRGLRRCCSMVAGIALAMFIALVGWGKTYFGWSDPSGKVQLALVTAFILGSVASYKARG